MTRRPTPRPTEDTARGWIGPVVVAAITVLAFEGANRLHVGLGLWIASVIIVAGIVGLIVTKQRK